MAAAQNSQPSWFWDEANRLWYYHDRQRDERVYYDFRTDQLIYENGQRIPRTPYILRPRDIQAPNPNIASSPASSQDTYRLSRHASRSSGGDFEALTRAATDLSLEPSQPSEPERRAGPVQPQVTYARGIRFVLARNEGNVETRFATEPPEYTTDPNLLAQGVHAERRLLGTPGTEESLYPSFKFQRPSFFCVGRVFLILWSEPAGESATVVTSYEPTHALKTGVFEGRYGEMVFSKVRRFVVVRQTARFSTAVPIMTYDHQGVGKSGVVKSDHAVIFTGKQPPAPLESERPERDEAPMRPNPIRVDPDELAGKLDPLSRINFGKVHTIEHNLKVKSVGKVHPRYLEALVTQFGNVVLGSTATRNVAQPTRDTATPRSSRQQPHPARYILREDTAASRVQIHVRSQHHERDEGVEGDEGGDDETEEVRGDEDEEEDDEGEDGDTRDEHANGPGRPSPSTLTPYNLIYNHLISLHWSGDEAARETGFALRARNRYSELLRHQYNPRQALDRLVTELQDSARVNQSAALQRVQARLLYGNQSSSQR